ncbi:MAG: hypothetical protein LBI40_04085 [Treponema sp.]|jgi:hypothetical protein|nr:hypothetical protein [Treponema sp.]
MICFKDLKGFISGGEGYKALTQEKYNGKFGLPTINDSGAHNTVNVGNIQLQTK